MKERDIKRITFELDKDNPLYLQLMEYSKKNFMTLSGVIRLALQKLFNEENNL